MDYLPIQASAVPCEHIFSSSGETYTKRRNRISPPLMEALQMVKFSLKKERLNFTEGWQASQKDMEYDLMCALSSGDSSSSGSSDLLTSAIGGLTPETPEYEALLRIIAEQECDDVPDVPVVV
jgi:hypothetical protein